MSSKVEILFKQFDENNDGVLDINEVYKMLKKVEELMKKSGKSFTVNSNTVNKLFKLTDKDGDGKISLEEMSLLLKNATTLNN